MLPFLPEVYLNAFDVTLTLFVFSCPPGDLVVTRFVHSYFISTKQETLNNRVKDLPVLTSPELLFTTVEMVEGGIWT